LSAREIHDAVEHELGWSYSSTRKTPERMWEKGMISQEVRHGVQRSNSTQGGHLKLIATAVLVFSTSVCAHPVSWDTPQKPFTLYGNTYYVGTAGISAVLITSREGHILIDGTGAEGAPIVADNIRSLGYKLADVKYILNSHAHSDHAGGIAALQKLSGATVVAGRANLATLASGKAGRDDPQYGDLDDFEPVPAALRGVGDGEVIHVGPLAVTAHATPGHTPGGVTWTWTSCVDGICENLVFADSLRAGAADGYRFTDHADLVATFRTTYAAFGALPCDILVTAHPEANDLLDRLQRRDKAGVSAFIDPNACHDLAAYERDSLNQRLAKEQ
jgi:metallo-beta-lactamase class B